MQLRIKRASLLLPIILLFWLIPLTDVHGGLVPCGGEGQPGCELCHLFEMVSTIIDIIVWRVVPAIAVLLLIYAGFGYITSLGNPSALGKTKKVFTAVITGLVLTFLSWALVVAIYYMIGAEADPTSWWSIPKIANCP